MPESLLSTAYMAGLVDMSELGTHISWAQINNAIVPVIHRKCDDVLTDLLLVPLLVIRYAAGLLTDVHVDTVYCTGYEARALTKCCKDVGIEVEFHERTELISLDSLIEFSKERIVLFMLSSRESNVHTGSVPHDKHFIEQRQSSADNDQNMNHDELIKSDYEINKHNNDIKGKCQRNSEGEIRIAEHREDITNKDESGLEIKPKVT